MWPRVSVTMGVVAPVVQRIATVKAVWTIASDGSVDLRMTVERDTRMPFLPRFGLRMLLPRTMDRVSYCGLGPLESYVDKRRASWHGVFSGTPQTLFEPYIKPQENGNHHDCDWGARGRRRDRARRVRGAALRLPGLAVHGRGR